MRAMPLWIILLASLVGCGHGSGAAGSSTAPVAASGATGSWSGRFLAAAPYRSLLVEVGYVAGEAPSESALALLQQRLAERCDKPDGVQVILDAPITSGTTSVYSVPATAALEAANRRHYASGSQAVLYLVYLDGHSDQDTSSSAVLAWTYTGTSIGVFKESIKAASNGLVPPDEVEATVLVHEAGHALGLVNLGAPLRSAHEDTTHAGHCSDERCAVFWQVESSNIRFLLKNGGKLPTDYDTACKEDLHANGGL